MTVKNLYYELLPVRVPLKISEHLQATAFGETECGPQEEQWEIRSSDGRTLGVICDKVLYRILGAYTFPAYQADCMRTECEYEGDNEGYRVFMRLLHAVMGISTEANELLTTLKAVMYYGREMDMTNIIEELGDMDWFRAILYDVLGVTEQQVWTKNINKLYARYPEKFSQECANNRDLENERRVLEGNPASDNSLPEKKD